MQKIETVDVPGARPWPAARHPGRAESIMQNDIHDIDADSSFRLSPV
jgi:hypothetical protein